MREAEEERIIEGLKKAAREAGSIMLHASRHEEDVFAKDGRANFVTVYDEKIQEFLIGQLKVLIPDAHFVGEEEGEDVFLSGYEKGFTFIIDPIDGTTNFMCDYRASVASIALFRDGKPFMGVIYNPYMDQMFSARKGKGAFENGRRIMSSDKPLSGSLVNMGTTPYYDEETRRNAFRIGFWYMQRSLDVRRSGSAAYDLCLVASGRAGLFFESMLSLWDYAAGALIVEEAGGRVTDFDGKEMNWRGKSSVCAVSRGVRKEEYLPPRHG